MVQVTTKPDPRPSTFAAFQVPSYGRLWGSGFLWNLTRSMAMFLCSYLVNDLTGSPLLVQLVGAAFFAPMFFAGAVGGAISDRFDRRRTILRQLGALVPIAALMAALVLSGAVRVWMVYPFMLAIGLGGVFDMTSRRALIFDFVGPERVTNALAMESLSMTGGNMLGALVGGAVIALLSIGWAFGVIAVCYAAALALLLGVRTPPHVQAAGGGVSILRDLLAGFRTLRHNRTLVSILGVTVLMNAFFYSYTPMVPVFAARLGVGAFLAGVLASAMGLGSIVGSLLIAAKQPRERGLVYVGGATLAMLCLTGLAGIAWYPGAALSLALAGVGAAGFATMQSVLVMSTATPQMRGRALGMLSMAIGALPFAMAGLGVVAQATGPRLAVGGSALLGVAGMALWNLRRPEARRLL